MKSFEIWFYDRDRDYRNLYIIGMDDNTVTEENGTSQRDGVISTPSRGST